MLCLCMVVYVFVCRLQICIEFIASFHSTSGATTGRGNPTRQSCHLSVSIPRHHGMATPPALQVVHPVIAIVTVLVNRVGAGVELGGGRLASLRCRGQMGYLHHFGVVQAIATQPPKLQEVWDVSFAESANEYTRVFRDMTSIHTCSPLLRISYPTPPQCTPVTHLLKDSPLCPFIHAYLLPFTFSFVVYRIAQWISFITTATYYTVTKVHYTHANKERKQVFIPYW